MNRGNMKSTPMKTLDVRHAIEHFIESHGGKVYGGGMFVDGSSADISASIEGIRYKITIEPKDANRSSHKTLRTA